MMTNTTTTATEPHAGERGREVPYPPGKPPSKPRKRGFIWFFFLVIVIGVTAYAVWRASQPGLIPQTNQGKGGGRGKGGRGGGAGGALPVAVAAARSGSVPIYLVGLGNVTAFYTVTVKSRVDGQLMKVNFQEGELVKEGQVLCEIDPRPFQVMLAQAEGTLAHDQALLENAKVDLNRYDGLVKQQAIPAQQLDTQKALVAQYEGSIAQDKANVDNAKLQLIYSKITAPITGTVGLRLVDPGNIVHASDANGMIVITQLQPISVLFTIPEDNLPEVTKKLRAGAHLPVEAFNRDMSKKLSAGTLLTLDNQIDNTTGTSKLKAIFDNKDFELFPQQFVNIRLLVDTLQNQILVPTVAVQTGQQGTFVYVIDENQTAHLRPVEVLTSDQSGADIKSGLKVGEQVAVDGADRLEDGARVRVRQAGEVEKQAADDAAALANRARNKGKGGQFKGQPGGNRPDGKGAPQQ
ncbi:MAG TPA: MdtA/MuxA family multidrug efflux RND transporter periplasmic adaptor subunit [Bryobacteraceae bacterium]|nr:MdtA/MuxA family multidrug efflux RND transporter periplasmic adaptor subunit [Bryobacteraceae bacterium]